MSDETPRYEPYLQESTGHTFSLGMDGDEINHDHDNETEPSYFTDPPKYDLKKLQKETRQNFSLGLHSGEDRDDEETEPPLLVNPPEYDVEEVKARSGQKEKDDA